MTVEDEPRELRSARIAHILARAVRDGEVAAADALRILRHELRRKNTNKKEAIVTRSVGAQRAIEQYGGGNVPKNSSPDALHADHVYPLSEATLHRTTTVEAWATELRRVSLVVCVTAEENYRLMNVEAAGVTGPAKYAEAGVELIGDALPPSTPMKGSMSLVARQRWHAAGRDRMRQRVGNGGRRASIDPFAVCNAVRCPVPPPTTEE